jgi:type I restriction enzyme M protein
MGHMVDRVRREFSDDDIETIAGTYRRWRAKPEALAANDWDAYEDIAGFCKSEGLETICKYDHVLTPGRYVGAAAAEDDGVPFEEKFATYSAELKTQFDKSRLLDDAILQNLLKVPSNV